MALGALAAGCGRHDVEQARIVTAQVEACELYYVAIASYPPVPMAPRDRVFEAYLACLQDGPQTPQVWDIAPLGRFSRTWDISLADGGDGRLAFEICGDLNPDAQADITARLTRSAGGWPAVSAQGHSISLRDCSQLR